jgi:PPP family 3-phenylpropionic acid transporter
MFLSSLAVLGYGWQGGFWFFLGWTIFRVLLSNPLGPLVDSLTLDHLEERPHLSYGHFRVWGAIGWTISAYAMGYVIAGRDMRLVFVAAAAMMVLAGGTVLRTPRELGGAGVVGSSWRDVGILLRNRRLVIFLVLVMFVSVGIMPLFTFYPIYMNDLGASRQLLGLASSLLGLSELPLFFFADRIIKRIGHARAMSIACFFFAVRAILYSFISEPAWATAVQVLHAPFSLYLMASIEYINQQVPRVWRATGQSLFWMVRMGAGGIIGNALAGFLYDRLEIQMIFRLLGMLILVVAVAMVVVLRERPAGGMPAAGASD